MEEEEKDGKWRWMEEYEWNRVRKFKKILKLKNNYNKKKE